MVALHAGVLLVYLLNLDAHVAGLVVLEAVYFKQDLLLFPAYLGYPVLDPPYLLPEVGVLELNLLGQFILGTAFVAGTEASLHEGEKLGLAVLHSSAPPLWLALQVDVYFLQHQRARGCTAG